MLQQSSPEKNTETSISGFLNDLEGLASLIRRCYLSYKAEWRATLRKCTSHRSTEMPKPMPLLASRGDAIRTDVVTGVVTGRLKRAAGFRMI
jgi:hypothetical protein